MKLKITLLSTLPLLAFLLVLPRAHAQRTDSTVVKNELPNQIAIGFGKQQKEYVTGSISTVIGDDLRKAYYNKIGSTLAGRLSGLTVRQNGFEPGNNSTTLNIRGLSTYGFSNGPLIIVDGFISDYDLIIPEEVAEISILKDAAATAVYGLRAANGVVLVTTKKGSIKPLAVNFTAQYGVQAPTEKPKFLDSYNYASLYNEARRNEGLTDLYSASDLELYQNNTDPAFHPNINWYNEVLRPLAPQSNYNLSFTGGTNVIRYFALVNSLSSDGLYKNFGDKSEESSNSKYKRLNFRSNVEVTLNKNLSAQLNLGAAVEDKRNPGELTTNNTFGLIDRIPPNVFPARLAGDNFAFSNAYTNPLAALAKTGFSTSNSTTLQSSLRVTELLDMVTPGLSASAAVSFNSYYSGVSNKRKLYSSLFLSPGNDPVVFGLNTSLVGTEAVQSQWNNNAVQAFLNYDRTFAKHSISAMLMYNSDYFLINKNYPGTNAAGNDIPYKTNGASSRITYINNGKYIAGFSASYMGSNAFTKGKRYGFTPAGSLGWIVSKENFLKDSKIIDFLKIRGSYGLVGNENIGGLRFGYSQRYPFVDGYIFTGTTKSSAIAEGQRANPDLTWEKDKKANIGFELKLLKRVALEMDLFENNRYDILSKPNTTIPVFLGFNDSPELNIGKVNSKGLDMTVKYETLSGAKTSFYIEGNASYNKNKVIYRDEAFQINANRISTGMPIDYGFGLQATGFWTQDEINITANARPIGVVIRPGDLRYKDIGGASGIPDGLIDGNDATAIGNYSLPSWTFGMRTGVKYKAFDLDLFFQGVSGIDVNLGGDRNYAFQNNGQVSEIALGRWTPQTAATATYPRLSTTGNNNNFRFSSFWKRDGSFVKLRSMELGYAIPSKLLKRLKIEQTRLFLNGTNLFSLDYIKGADPEALGGYPALRTVSLGVNVNL